MARHLICAAFVAATAGLLDPAGVRAQTLTDPMRPPIEHMPPGALSSNTLPNAQVVILGQDRRLVTLNGQTVSEGGRIGDSRVETLNDSEVVLRIDRRTRERVPLYPGISKTPSVVATGPAKGIGTGRNEGKK